MPTGSQDLVIPTSGGVTYTANNFKFDEATTSVISHNKDGKPSREAQFDDPRKGTATLQLATPATVRPSRGAAFTAIGDTGESLHFKVSSVGKNYENRGETLLELSFTELLNP